MFCVWINGLLNSVWLFVFSDWREGDAYFMNKKYTAITKHTAAAK